MSKISETFIQSDPGHNNPVGYGQYYCRLMIGKFSRQQPFAESTWEPKEVIFLPLPSELRDDTGVGYSNLDLESVGDLFNNTYVGLGAARLLRKSGNLAVDTVDAVGNQLLGAVTGGDENETVADIFPPNQVTSAIQQALGMAPNPNPSVAFSGPTLREFTMSWAFYPKNEREAANIKKTIETLKKRALPENSIGKSAAVLNYPHMCQLNFYPWDQGGRGNWFWHPENSIIRIKRCVMSSVNANYTPSNVPAFHSSSSPGKQSAVAIQLTINFKELEYMLSKDWGGVDGAVMDSVGQNLSDGFTFITDKASSITGSLLEAVT